MTNNQEVKEIIQKIENLLLQLKQHLGNSAKDKTTDVKNSISSLSASNFTKKDQESLVLNIVNKVGDCAESEQIKSKILDMRSQEAKLLLCLYISYKYFSNQWLNSGDMEKITSELGIKIDARNITNKLKEIKQYLESGSTRKKGQPTPYRLNRKGISRFEAILLGIDE